MPGWFDAPATCLAVRCFCEAPRAGVPVQPADAWSNLAYLAAGAAILRAGGPDAGPFGVIVLLLGLTSGWFHATLAFGPEWLDRLAMYAIPLWLLAANLRRGGVLSPRAAVAAFLAVLAPFAAWIFRVPGQPALFGAVVAAYVASELWVRRRAPGGGTWFAAGAACFAAAYAFWLADWRWCRPDSLLQAHAAWHVLVAAALYCLQRRQIS